jgi:hypothetical protein
MRRAIAVLALTALGVLALGTGVAHGQATASIIGWGENDKSQCDAPSPNEGFVDLAAGRYHSLGVKSDGTIVAWYHNLAGQCLVPPPNEGFIAVAAGYEHSIGLKSDGTVVAWGYNDLGQCDVPAPNSNFEAIEGGVHTSLGLKSDGSIVVWGWNNAGQCDVPAPNTGFVDLAGGKYHNLGLKSDGTIVAWGNDAFGQCSVPAPNSGFTEVAAGELHSLGLRSDGSIVAWGNNDYSQCVVPAPNGDFVAVAAGGFHGLGLKSDGTIVAWGRDDCGQCTVPAPNGGFDAIAGGTLFSLGLTESDSPVEGVFYATVTPEEDAVVLRWILPGCPGVGMRVYRSVSVDGPYSCVTTEPLPDPEYGSFVDETVWPGGVFWYELRAVLASGEEELATYTRPRAVVPGTLTFGIRHVTPNPATTGASIGCALPAGWRAARLSVHDVAGRVVRRLDPAAGSNGLVTLEWDGATSSGARAASGVYLVRLEVDGEVATSRLVMLH